MKFLNFPWRNILLPGKNPTYGNVVTMVTTAVTTDLRPVTGKLLVTELLVTELLPSPISRQHNVVVLITFGSERERERVKQVLGL